MSLKKHIPNFITSLNLTVGSIGIYFVLVGNPDNAIYFVLGAAFFDFFDGLAARALNVQSAIGKELDSLADLVSFGVLPAFYMLRILSFESDYFFLAIAIIVFSALRLAQFNIDESQSDSFKGLPTPANAIMLTSLVYLDFELNELTLITIILLSSWLLVSGIPLLALKFKSYRWKNNEWRWILILLSIGLSIVFQWTILPFLIPLYVIISVLSVVINNRAT